MFFSVPFLSVNVFFIVDIFLLGLFVGEIMLDSGPLHSVVGRIKLALFDFQLLLPVTRAAGRERYQKASWMHCLIAALSSSVFSDPILQSIVHAHSNLSIIILGPRVIHSSESKEAITGHRTKSCQCNPPSMASANYSL
jgi:hypothetical protein